jgi:hypothetical protein
MAADGISTLQFKRDRVIAKLDLAEAKRIEQNNPRPFYDLELLPTLPGIDSNDPADIVNNPNPGGLQPGRPWVADPLFNFDGDLEEFEGTLDLEQETGSIDLMD